MGAIARPRSVDSSDKFKLMRAFIIGNGINWALLSYDLMDATILRSRNRPLHLQKLTGFTSNVVITTANYCYLYGSYRSVGIHLGDDKTLLYNANSLSFFVIRIRLKGFFGYHLAVKKNIVIIDRGAIGARSIVRCFHYS